MAKSIRINAGDIQITAKLRGNTTAKAIWNALPIKARANTWGDEIYFPILVERPEEDALELVSMGDIAYWPPGKAFCIFFGSTPISGEGEIRPAGPVNVVGAIEGDPSQLRRVGADSQVTLERLEE